MKITLQDIIDQTAEQNGTTKKLSEDFLRELFTIIEETLGKGDVVKIKGLGTFKLQTVDERKSVNVQTGEEIIIPAHNKISFTPEKELKAAINKPYSHLETYVLSHDGPVDGTPDEENEDEENEYVEMVDNEEKKSPVVEKGEPALIVPQPVIIETEEEQAVNIDQAGEQPETVKTETEPQPEVAVEKAIEEEVLSEIIESGEEPLPEVVEKDEVELVGSEITEIKCEEKKNCKCKLVALFIILGLIALLAWLWHDYSPHEVPVKEEVKTADIQHVVESDDYEFDEDTTGIGQFSDVKIIDETAENAYVYNNPENNNPENNESKNNESKNNEPENEEPENEDATTPNPNRQPEFEGEYMFDDQFDFRLLDFMQANYPSMKLITYGTPRKVELKAGKRLTLVALEYYGNKQFWVYIYFYNTDVIRNPNNVPVGSSAM